MVAQLCDEDSDTMLLVSGQCQGVAQAQHMSPSLNHNSAVARAGDNINSVL